MKKKIIPYIIYSILISFYSCLTGGTHGSIENFEFNATKDVLERAVKNVILKNPYIIQDTTKGYYNNDSIYVTFIISKEDKINEYVFRYYGGKKYWESAKTSIIGIAYAYNKDRKGGSAGNDGVNWYNFELKNELIPLFEKEFVSKVEEEILLLD